jgi:hypothetical protein
MLPFVTLFLVVFALSPGVGQAQDYPILWVDNFDDDDPALRQDVGWFYYGESDGLIGQTVQQQDGEAFLEAGSYGGIAGVALIETNGIALLDSADEEGTKANLIANNYSDPNVILTFKVKFVRFSTSFFAATARMVQTDTSETFPDADPTESPGYPLFISPLEDVVRIGKYAGELLALQPDQWTYFGEAEFDFDLDVYYWVQYYLNEGDLKCKIWEGDLADGDSEPWLIEATDPEPRVNGKFVMFSVMGTPPAQGEGDQVILDDVMAQASVITSVADNSPELPAGFELAQNYPNPFNPSTSISFSLSQPGNVKLAIYNLNGQLVRTLLNTQMTSGQHNTAWDGMDDHNNPVTSGIYLYRLTSGHQTLSKRMVLLK